MKWDQLPNYSGATLEASSELGWASSGHPGQTEDINSENYSEALKRVVTNI